MRTLEPPVGVCGGADGLDGWIWQFLVDFRLRGRFLVVVGCFWRFVMDFKWKVVEFGGVCPFPGGFLRIFREIHRILMDL